MSSRRGVDPSTRRSIVAVALAMAMVASMPATAGVASGTSTPTSDVPPTDLEVSPSDRPTATSPGERPGSSGPEAPGSRDNETGAENGTFRLEPGTHQPLVPAGGVYETTVIVRNTGPVADRQRVTLGAIGQIQDSQWLTLSPGERREVTLTWRPTNAAGQFRWTVRTDDDAIGGWVLVESEQVGTEYGDIGVESASAQPIPLGQELPTTDNWGGNPIRQWESPSRPLMVKVDTSKIADDPNEEVDEVLINGEQAQEIDTQRDYRKEIDSYDSSPAGITVKLVSDGPNPISIGDRHSWETQKAAWYDPFDNLIGSNLDEKQEWTSLDGDWDEGQTDRKVKFSGPDFTLFEQEVLPHPGCRQMVLTEADAGGGLGVKLGPETAFTASLKSGGELKINCVGVEYEGKGTLQIANSGDLDTASLALSIKFEREQSVGFDVRLLGELEVTVSAGVQTDTKFVFDGLWKPKNAILTVSGTLGISAETTWWGYGISASADGKLGPRFEVGTGDSFITYKGIVGSVTFKIGVEGDGWSKSFLEYKQSGTLAQANDSGLQKIDETYVMPADGFDRLVVEPGTPFAGHTRITNRTFDDLHPAVTDAPAVTDDVAVITSTQPAGETTYTLNLVQQEYDPTTGEWVTGPELTSDSSRNPTGTAVAGGNETAVLAATFNTPPQDLKNWSYEDYVADPRTSVGFLSHDGGSWETLQRLTNSTSFHQAPDVAVTRTDDAAIAYEVYEGPPSRERNPRWDAGEIAYHLVTNGTVTANRSVANATSPEVDTLDGALRLSYYDNETDAVVTGELDASGAFNRTDQYSVDGRYLDHATDGDELVIGTRDEQDIDNVTIRHVDANGTVEEVPTVPLISVSSFELDSGEDRSVVSYTGVIENDTGETDAIRHVRSNGTWSEPLLLSGGLTTNVSTSAPSQTIVDGDPTVAYVAREEGVGPAPLQENRTAGDVFLTRVNSTSTLTIDELQGPDNATAGENVTVTATVRNAGSDPGSGVLTVLGDAGTQLASRTLSLDPRARTIESFDGIELPESGTISATIETTGPQASTVGRTSTESQSNWSPWLSQNASVRLAGSNLSVTDIESRASSVTSGTVDVTVENGGSAFAIDEVVRLEDASSILSDKTVPALPPGANTTLSWDVAPANLDLSGQAGVTIDPDPTSIPDRYAVLFEPALTPGTVTYHDTSNGTTALFTLNNSGVGAAHDVRTTIYRTDLDGTEIGTRSVATIPGEDDRYVSIPLSNVSENEFYDLFVDAWGQSSQPYFLFLNSILEDNFSVDAIESDRSGDRLTVTTNVTNTGTDGSEQAIELAIDGELRTQALVSRTPGESGNVTLTANTSDVETLSSATVSSLDDADELRSSFAVNNLTLEQTNVSREEGINVSVDLANVGGLASQREIRLLVNGTAVATRTVALGSGNGTVVTYENVTFDLPPRNYEVRVDSDDDSAVTEVTVGDPQGYACSIANENDEITTTVLFDAIDDWRRDDIDLPWLFAVIDDWRSSDPVSC